MVHLAHTSLSADLFYFVCISVAEFAQKVSLAHEQFANQVLNVVETFKKKNTELRKDR